MAVEVDHELVRDYGFYAWDADGACHWFIVRPQMNPVGIWLPDRGSQWVARVPFMDDVTLNEECVNAESPVLSALVNL